MIGLFEKLTQSNLSCQSNLSIEKPTWISQFLTIEVKTGMSAQMHHRILHQSDALVATLGNVA